MGSRFRHVGGIADQALSSGSNILFVLAVARVSSSAEFGIFSFAYVVLTLTLSLARGALGTPISLLARTPHAARVETSWAMRRAIAWSLPLSISGGVSLGMGPPDLDAASVLVLFVPAILAQDLLRFEAAALQRYGVAILADGLWAAASLCLLALTWIPGRLMTAEFMTATWGFFGLIALTVLAVSRCRTRPGSRGRMDVHEPSERVRLVDRLRLGFDSSMGGIVTMSISAIVASVLSPVALAGLRGASAMVGPVNVLISSLQIAVIPRLVQRPHASMRQMLQITAPTSLPVAACAVGVGLLGLLLPDYVGELLLGETWTVAAPVLVVLGCEYVGQSLLTAALTILRARRATRQLVRFRVIMGIGQVAAGAGAAILLGSAVSVAAASATIVWIMLPLAFVSAAKASRRTSVHIE